ncbi:LacI family DNA-binding transcriptional regulator [Nonomuraea diastatica]|uniref:LacI family transcriptional regulator n=1 Tax=Nonomuraea diastatica TaxID=1848329 RepID=A0A4R4WUZ2_9ACTN|nr:LacI family DNA-binding transcriptional regulator [Nonomuraea diastatica]TDD21506.1 LacI family transcriptional regulator [Nonomuraea diastatica]
MTWDRAVTRNDVARYAQVSPAVVSYVVNKGPKRVRPETEARVLEAIRVLGYRPNAAARALKLRSQEIFGLVLSSGGNALFVELANAIEDAAKAERFAVILTNSRASAAKEREHLRNLVARQVDGILLASVDAVPDISDVSAAGVPIVLLDNTGTVPAVPSLGADLEGGAYAAVSHLIGHGHQRIGMISGPPGDHPDGRETGWLRALSEHGLPEGPLLPAKVSRFGGYQAARRMLAFPGAPTAIFTSGDAQAVGALRAIHEAGKHIPEDVAVISFDGSTEAEYTWPPLSTMRQPVDEIARDAVTALLALKAGGGTPPQHRHYTTTLQARGSCGCADTPA